MVYNGPKLKNKRSAKAPPALCTIIKFASLITSQTLTPNQGLLLGLQKEWVIKQSLKDYSNKCERNTLRGLLLIR